MITNHIARAIDRDFIKRIGGQDLVGRLEQAAASGNNLQFDVVDLRDDLGFIEASFNDVHAVLRQRIGAASVHEDLAVINLAALHEVVEAPFAIDTPLGRTVPAWMSTAYDDSALLPFTKQPVPTRLLGARGCIRIDHFKQLAADSQVEVGLNWITAWIPPGHRPTSPIFANPPAQFAQTISALATVLSRGGLFLTAFTIDVEGYACSTLPEIVGFIPAGQMDDVQTVLAHNAWFSTDYPTLTDTTCELAGMVVARSLEVLARHDKKFICQRH